MQELSPIPLVDLKAQYQSIQSDVENAVTNAMRRGDYILGQDVKEFESKFADYCQTKYAVGCASGTDAIHLACRAAGIGPGDEVIVPAFTFIATALGVSLTGAKVVLVDVDDDTSLMDLDQVEQAITPQTKAIMPVHLYGQCVSASKLKDLANKHNLMIIEDAAQAHGASAPTGERAGSIGDLGCFSFYPGKNLGAYGDGGAIVTNNQDLYEEMLLIRNWGSRIKYVHDCVGLNSRLDTVQAAVLNTKLKHLDQWNLKRREHAQRYDQFLANKQGIRQTKYDDGSVYHLYVLRSENREEILKKLHEAKIMAGIHYPRAIHQHKAYQWLGYTEGQFPISESWARTCFSLPIYPELPEEAIHRVGEIL